MTWLCTGVAIGAADPITSVTVFVPGFEIHRLPAASTVIDPAAAVAPPGSTGVVSAAAPPFVSAVTVPLLSASHVTSLPSIASAVAALVLPVENVVDSAPTSVNSVTLVPPVAIDHNRPFASTAAPVPPPLTALLCEAPPSNTDVKLPPLFTTKIDCLRTVKRFVAVAVAYAPGFEGVNVAVSV